MLQQRSDTLKLTATQSQDKVLVLEQEKVRYFCTLQQTVAVDALDMFATVSSLLVQVKLASDLSSTMSELTALTLELATLRKRELQTSTQLETLVAAEKDLQRELTTAKLKASGSRLRGILRRSPRFICDWFCRKREADRAGFNATQGRAERAP